MVPNGPLTDDGLVQLLTPAGQRIGPPRLRRPGRAPRRRRPACAVPRHGAGRAGSTTRRPRCSARASSPCSRSALGQEAAQIGSGRALAAAGPRVPELPRARRRATPAASTSADVLRLFRGIDHGGWDPTTHGFHLYTLVIGSHTLHATGYAMGLQRDGAVGTGDPDRDSAVVAYFGDGSTSQGDVNEALVFAAVNNAPVVFFCQNNQWAISEPTTRQSRVPLADRGPGLRHPERAGRRQRRPRDLRGDARRRSSVRAAAAARRSSRRSRTGWARTPPPTTRAATARRPRRTTGVSATRSTGSGCTSRSAGELPAGLPRALDAEADELGERLRDRRSAAMGRPSAASMFEHVYAAPHSVVESERAWFEQYEASFLDASQSARGATDERACPDDDDHRRADADDGQGHQPRAAKALERARRCCSWARTSGALGGVFRVTDGLQKDFGDDRVVDTPLAESGIVGTAIGLALRGYRPVCEIQFDGFIFPAFDQITTQLAKMHYRSQGRLTLPVVIRVPYGGGIGAVEHHSESPEALFAHTAGLRVVSPSSPADAFTMIQQAIASPDPVLFFEPKGRYWEKGDGRPRRARSAPPHPAPRPRARCCARAPTSRSSPTARRSRPRSRPPRPPPPRARASRSSTCARSPRSTPRRWPPPCAAPAAASSSTRRPCSTARAPRSPHASPRSASTTCRRPCCVSAGSTRPYPVAKIEHDYLPGLDRRPRRRRPHRSPSDASLRRHPPCRRTSSSRSPTRVRA